MLLQFQMNTFTYLFTKWLSIGLTPGHGCLRNRDVMAFLKLRLHSLCKPQGGRGYFLWGNFVFISPTSYRIF